MNILEKELKFSSHTINTIFKLIEYLNAKSETMAPLKIFNELNFITHKSI